MKLYPSSTSWLRDGQVQTKYASACLRSILLKFHGIKDTSFDPKHSERGAWDEHRWEQILISEGRVYQREVPLKYQIPDTDFHISGRCDFLLPTERLIIEKKSSESPSVLTMLNKNLYKSENLAQIVLYMLITGFETGHLIYSYYKVSKSGIKVYTPHVDKVYVVTIADNGNIQVDGKFSKYTVDDLVQHLMAQTEIFDAVEVPPRPANYDSQWEGPCGMCPFSKSCTAYDDGLVDTAEEFINLTKKLQANPGLQS